jgi:hypothetical protein
VNLETRKKIPVRHANMQALEEKTSQVVAHFTEEAGVWQWVIYPIEEHGAWLTAFKTLEKAQEYCTKKKFTIERIQNDRLKGGVPYA